MTYSEATERASVLWTNVVNVYRARYDPERWTIHCRTADGMNRRQHSMDGVGRPTCHAECIERETHLGEVADP